ncbi:hypothetical protein ACT80S_10610 [Ramlibacter sp. MAHUQ-53]|uniref:hypothetical protein n=1 Tax=unclassified Ramlibacter TaxID=2617605 RepID=UPI0036456E9E
MFTVKNGSSNGLSHSGTSAYETGGGGLDGQFPGEAEWREGKSGGMTPRKTPPVPSQGPSPVTQRAVEHLPPPSSTPSAYGHGQDPVQVVVHPPTAPAWQPPQSYDDAMAIAVPVGLANAGRRLVAGVSGVVAGTYAAAALEQALPPAGGSLGAQALGILGTGVAMATGTALAAHGLAQVMDCKASGLAKKGLALALSGGIVPMVAARTASSSSLAQGQERAAAVAAQFVSGLVAALGSEVVMQVTDGATPRARIVENQTGAAPGPGNAVFREWPLASSVVYAGAGLAAEVALAPGLQATFGKDLPAGAAAALGSQLAQALAQTVLELYDALVAAGLANYGSLKLEAVKGQAGAICRNLCRVGETVGRIVSLAGVRTLLTSPAQFLQMAETLYAGQPGTREALRIVRGVVEGLARLNGHLVQEAHPVRRAQPGWAAEFRPNYEAFIGSGGSGLDIREADDDPPGTVQPATLRRRHQAAGPGASVAASE